jgi:hypothetical protein
VEIAVLVAETLRASAPLLGQTPHPVVPPSLAPPDLIRPLRRFFEEHPFERNVLGMTRFPGKPEKGDLDPIEPALERARSVCRDRGLVFHLASDRQIVDGVWENVAAHMWACQYGIGFFENRTPRGLNYNLTIEVGACLMTGRRVALLKDAPLEKLPTDLVGRIYKEVDLDDPQTVGAALEAWIDDDLGL